MPEPDAGSKMFSLENNTEDVCYVERDGKSGLFRLTGCLLLRGIIVRSDGRIGGRLIRVKLSEKTHDIL